MGRQPIFDLRGHAVGYELLFRTGGVQAAFDGYRATAEVVVGSLTEIGLERLVGGAQAWINVDRAFLVDGLATTMPPGQTVLEILEDQVVDDELVRSARELRRLGYRIALDDFVYTPEAEPLLAVADVVKLDVRALGLDGLAEHVQRLSMLGVGMVAEKVETHEEHIFCREAGCALFQGYFFCRPETVRAGKVAPGRLALLQLISALQDPAVEFEEVERLLVHDAALAYRLLSYVNSAFFSLRQQVSSIAQALVLLGIENARRWATLSLFAGVGGKPRELTVTALLRARFCELAGASLAGVNASELFTLGLFSVIDALLDMPIEEIMVNMPFTDSLRDALLRRAGVLGSLIECVAALEAGQHAAAESIVPEAPRYYVEAIGWAGEAARSLFAAA